MLAAGLAAGAMATWRIDFVGNWSGRAQVYSIAAAGGSVASVTDDERTDFSAPQPSPDGRSVLFRDAAGDVWVARSNGGDAHRLWTSLSDSPPPAYTSWSPDSSKVAYVVGTALHVVRADGTEDRVVRDPAARFNGDDRYVVRWTRGRPRLVAGTPGGRYDVRGSTIVLRSTGAVVGQLDCDCSVASSAWAPDGRMFAYSGYHGIELFDVGTRKNRVLTTDRARSLAWRPDGGVLAYIDGATGDLRTVTPDDRVHVVARGGARDVGVVTELAWSRAAPLRYERPPARAGIYTTLSVDMLAAGGSRVAYDTCNDLHIWTPATGGLVDRAAFEPCDNTDFITSLAVGDAGLVYSMLGGGIDKRWEVVEDPLTSAPTTLTVGGDICCTSYPVVGGTAPTLVWADGTGGRDTHTWTIRTVGGATLETFQQDGRVGVALDTDGDRVLVARDGAIDVLQAGTGAMVLHLDVGIDPTISAQERRPPEARLMGDYVVTHIGGYLGIYWISGRLSDGRPIPADSTLQDATDGAVAYTDSGEVYVLRFGTGQTYAVAPGQRARFFDGGLAIANGARVSVVPIPGG